MSLPPVLLVHGFGNSAATTWGENGWLDLLADEGRETIAPDLLGHGSSPKPHDPRAYDGLEADLARHLPPGGGPVDGIGFSLGARLLLTVAADRPDRFRKLVLGGVGANLFRGDSPIEGAGPEDKTADYFVQLMQGSGNDPAALEALRQSPRPPLDDGRLGKVTCPVLVVIGDADFAGPGDPLVEALPDAQLKVLRGVDHFATPKAMGFLDAALRFIG